MQTHNLLFAGRAFEELFTVQPLREKGGEDADPAGTASTGLLAAAVVHSRSVGECV